MMATYGFRGQIRLSYHRPDGGLIRPDPWFDNGIITAKLDDVGNVYFLGAAATGSNWYAGLISSDATLAATDTMASHAGWTEFTGYDESARPAWAPGTSTARQWVNSTAMIFTMSARIDAGDVGGLFICSDSTKGGSSGELWAHGLDDSPSLEVGSFISAYYLLEIREV